MQLPENVVLGTGPLATFDAKKMWAGYLVTLATKKNS